MIRRWAVCCAVSMAVTTTALAAERPLKGPKETLACRLGTEDRHARIAVVLIGGKTSEFAYYTKWKPRTCSIYLQRNRDSYSKWADTGNMTTVNLEQGVVLIEHKKGEYRFEFRDIDRERYCGMDGRINGSLTIRKGHDECQVEGIMEEGTPLGQAYANRRQEDEAAAVSAVTESVSTPSAPPATASVPSPVQQNVVAVPQTAVLAPPPTPPPNPPPAVSAATDVTPQATASAPPPPIAEKATESGWGNAFRAFVRALTQPRAADPPSQ